MIPIAGDIQSKSLTWRTLGLLVLIIAVGAVIRLILISDPGYPLDVVTSQQWAEKGARYGLGHIYDSRYPGWVPDYPPFSLFLYTGVGYVTHALTGSFAHGPVFHALVKMPAILADLATTVLLFFVVREIGGVRRALAAASIYIFLPAVWFDSAIWGQSDAIYTLMICGALVCIAKGRFALFGSLVALAFATKFQSIIFAPLFVPFVLRNRRDLFTAVAAFSITAAGILLPFFLTSSLPSVFASYGHAVGAYTTLSQNAYNIWWSFFGGAADTVRDTETIFGISYRHWGISILVVVTFITTWRLWLAREDKGASLMLSLFTAAAILALVFFEFSTEMHERYLFPFMAFALPWAFESRRAAAQYAAISLIFFLNLLSVVPVHHFVLSIIFRRLPAIDVFLASALLFLTFAAVPGMIGRVQAVKVVASRLPSHDGNVPPLT